MGDVLIHHPQTGADVVVAEESLHHYRQSGWVLRSEHDQAQAQAQAQAAMTPKPAKPAASADEGK